MSDDCELCGENAEIVEQREAQMALRRVMRFLVSMAFTTDPVGRACCKHFRIARNRLQEAMDEIQNAIEEQEIANGPIDE